MLQNGTVIQEKISKTSGAHKKSIVEDENYGRKKVNHMDRKRKSSGNTPSEM
jgi:hypothetical protein